MAHFYTNYLIKYELWLCIFCWSDLASLIRTSTYGIAFSFVKYLCWIIVCNKIYFVEYILSNE